MSEVVLGLGSVCSDKPSKRSSPHCKYRPHTWTPSSMTSLFIVSGVLYECFTVLGFVGVYDVSLWHLWELSELLKAALIPVKHRINIVKHRCLSVWSFDQRWSLFYRMFISSMFWCPTPKCRLHVYRFWIGVAWQTTICTKKQTKKQIHFFASTLFCKSPGCEEFRVSCLLCLVSPSLLFLIQL